jgi:hypothetical protein
VLVDPQTFELVLISKSVYFLLNYLIKVNIGRPAISDAPASAGDVTAAGVLSVAGVSAAASVLAAADVLAALASVAAYVLALAGVSYVYNALALLRYPCFYSSFLGIARILPVATYFLASAVDSSFAEALTAASFHAVFLEWHILLLSLPDQIPIYKS